MPVSIIQRTVGRAINCSGVGLHSGKAVNLIIKPAPINYGIKFVRTDLPHQPIIPARFNCVVDTSLAIVLGSEGAIVSTVEHLMACLAGLSIDNVSIELDAYEVPAMDGSAAPFAQLILEAGIKQQDAKRHFFVIKKPIELERDEKFVGAYPDSTFRISCNIEFDHPLIQKQSYSIEVLDHVFECEVSKARTFCFLEEVEYMKRHGLARGGSLDNAIVMDKTKILNDGGLRYENEFVRHKLLDCIGDFSLLGMPILAHIIVSKSGHALNHAFLEKFFIQRESWKTQTLSADDDFSSNQAKSLAI